ncbi:hypothetical protein acdb102_39980 [Acidothermaceae bacterium B102]|nr:hypothetical protein acdb102_39980 [Acidothermaceae bacterium B102]
MPLRRVLACALVGASLLGGLTGCKYGDALSKREVVVLFKPGATQAQHRLLLASCSDVANAIPEPMGTGTMVSELASNVRFRVDKASDAELAQLTECFQKPQFASFVQSYDIPDLSH